MWTNSTLFGVYFLRWENVPNWILIFQKFYNIDVLKLGKTPQGKVTWSKIP